MENKKHYDLTEEEKKQLEDELYELTREGGKVDQNIIAIRDAKAQGDLSENADYSAAREEQSILDARVKELNEILNNAKIISVDKSDKVALGKKIKVLFVEQNAEDTYQITGTVGADPFENKVSNESPIGRALIGHKKGETVSVTTENGHTFDVKILDVFKD